MFPHSSVSRNKKQQKKYKQNKQRNFAKLQQQKTIIITKNKVPKFNLIDLTLIVRSCV